MKSSLLSLLLMFLSVAYTWASPEPEYVFRFIIPDVTNGRIEVYWNEKEVFNGTCIGEFHDQHTIDEFESVLMVMIPDVGYSAFIEGQNYGDSDVSITLPLAEYTTFEEYPDGWSGSSLYTFSLPQVQFVNNRPIFNGDLNLDGQINVQDLVSITDIILGKKDADVIPYGKISSLDLENVNSDYMQIKLLDGSVANIYLPDIVRINYTEEGKFPNLTVTDNQTSSFRLHAETGQQLSMDIESLLYSYFNFEDGVLFANAHVDVEITSDNSPIYQNEGIVDAPSGNSYFKIMSIDNFTIYGIMKNSIKDHLDYIFPTTGTFTIKLTLRSDDTRFIEPGFENMAELTDIRLQ